MVTLQQAAQHALEALEHAAQDVADFQRLNTDLVDEAIKDLRQALEADAKPCACCGEGKARISVTRICDACGSEYVGRAEMDLAKRIEAEQQAEPVAEVLDEGGTVEYISYAQEPGAMLYAHPLPTIQLRDKVIKALTDYCNTGEIDCADDLLASVMYAADTEQQPSQQPLTEEKIADLFSVACRETFSGLERFIYFTRLVESFHNIK